MNNNPDTVCFPENDRHPNFATTENFEFVKHYDFDKEPLTLCTILSSYFIGEHHKRFLIVSDNRVHDRLKLLRALAYAIDAMTVINQKPYNTLSVEISYLECENHNLFTGTDMATHNLNAYLEKQEIDLLIFLEDLGQGTTATTHMHSYTYSNPNWNRHKLKSLTIPLIRINTNPTFLFATDEILTLTKNTLDHSLESIQQLSAYLTNYAYIEGYGPSYFHEITQRINDEYNNYSAAVLNFVDSLPKENKDITHKNAQNIINIFYHEFCHAIDFLNLAPDACDLELFNVDIWGGANHIQYSHDLLFQRNITKQVQYIYDEEIKKSAEKRNKTITTYDRSALAINARSQHRIQLDYYWEEISIPKNPFVPPRPL